MSSPNLFGHLESYIPGLDGSIQNRVSSRYLRESPGSASERVPERKDLVLNRGLVGNTVSISSHRRTIGLMSDMRENIT